MIHSHIRYLSLSQQQSRNYPNTVKKKKSFILLVAQIPMMKMLLLLSLKSASRSDDTNSLPESAMFSPKNFLDPSPHSVLIPQFPFLSNACSLCATILKDIFHQFDMRVTKAKTGNSTLDWTKGDYRRCVKLMQLV